MAVKRRVRMPGGDWVALEGEPERERLKPDAYEQEYHAILKACSDFGFSDTDDVPLSAIVRSAFQTLRDSPSCSRETDTRLLTQMRVVIEAVRAVGAKGYWDAPHWTMHVPQREINALFDLAYELDPMLASRASAPTEEQPDRVKRLARSFAQEWLRPNDPEHATPTMVDTLQVAMLAFFACASQLKGPR